MYVGHVLGMCPCKGMEAQGAVKHACSCYLLLCLRRAWHTWESNSVVTHHFFGYKDGRMSSRDVNTHLLTCGEWIFGGWIDLKVTHLDWQVDNGKTFFFFWQETWKLLNIFFIGGHVCFCLPNHYTIFNLISWSVILDQWTFLFVSQW